MQVTFHGAVTAQAQANEAVTVTVTKPDATKDTLTAYTLADLTYSVTKEYDVAGSYSAQSHGDEDAKYQAWNSAVKTFTISLATRTGTLEVTVT